MKALLTSLFSISLSIASLAQCVLPSSYSGNTGSNMTVMLTPALMSSLNATDENSYLVALSSEGVVIGSQMMFGLSQITIAVWGDDTQTPEPDGAAANELISFQLVNGVDIYDVEMPVSINYATNSLAVQPSSASLSINCMFGCTAPWAENFNTQATNDDGSCYLNGCTDQSACNYSEYATNDDGTCTQPGCTNDSFIEYYQQAYVAGCDDGSCTKTTSDLGIEAAFFVDPFNTGSNMTLGINLNNTVGLEGSVIAAFSDLNNDGNAFECVGLSDFQDGFFSLAIWGDDSTTPEAEGLTANETDVLFAVMTASGNVLAFNPNPEFTGYVTNSFSVINEFDFNVTIYGCMNPNYCNYNENAEEDDGTCMGSPGCTDNNYLEFDANASCTLEGSCSTTWENAYLSEIEVTNSLQMSLEASIANAEQAAITAQNLLNETINAASQAATTAQNLLNATIETAELEADNAATELNETINAASQAATTAQNLLNATIEAAELEADNAATVLNETINAASQAALDAQNLLNTTISNFGVLEENYLNEIVELEAPILIDLIEGWNTIGYTKRNSQDVVATFADISDYISILKNNSAQVYWPEFGFNGIGDLVPGQGYQLKIDQAFEGYFYPDTQGERIYINPTVPEWVIELPIDQHPNDVRSLVRVVNLLGQKVNPEDCIKGTTLIYLYSDASVEKKIN
jgi:hypothetical protein